MICMPCRMAWHSECGNTRLPDDRAGADPRNGLWCDCQHKDRDGKLVIAGAAFTPVLTGEEDR